MSKVIGIVIVAASLAACDVSPTGPTSLAPTFQAFAYPSPQVTSTGLILQSSGQSHVILPTLRGIADGNGTGQEGSRQPDK